MFRRLLSPRAALTEISSAPAGVQTLDFTVRPVRTLAELQQVAQLRHAAYGRHRDQQGAAQPDRYDFEPHAVVLAAIDKSDGRIVGTIRVVLGDSGPLELDNYVHLARASTGVPAEAARLAIGRTRHRTLVKLALWKAYYRLCMGHGIESMVLAARRPIDDDYTWLDFHDIGVEPLWFVPGASFPDPHRVLMQRLAGLQDKWGQKSHEFFRFNVELVHPDIRPFSDDGINPLSRLAQRRLPGPIGAPSARSLQTCWPNDLFGWMPV